MSNIKFDYGMIGLGTMGRNLAFNMNDHGYSVIGYDKNETQVETFKREAANRTVTAVSNLQELLAQLKTPRAIILLVPAGKIVDSVISEISPLLSENDLLMDWGNSHYTDTDRRITQLMESKIHFMGIGISGGEYGARYGPSIMPGGPNDRYNYIADMLQSVAAKVNGEPCVTWLGTGSAGHYVKMVHNGIEYGLMQLIAETYHILKKTANLNNNELHQVFTNWNKGNLHSYLIEITATIFQQKDELTGNMLVDMILDSAKQKGTGGWTSEDAINLQIPVPVIDLAVSMRNLSAYKKERIDAEKILSGPIANLSNNKDELISTMENALFFAMITVYAQGICLLQAASKKYEYNLQPSAIAKIWRGGCIIRAGLLEDIYKAFNEQPNLSNLMTASGFSTKMNELQLQIRKAVLIAVNNGIPAPALMASLTYYDAWRCGRLPANLVQAQRDYFGAHTYERIDREGTFHTQWIQTDN